MKTDWGASTFVHEELRYNVQKNTNSLTFQISGCVSQSDVDPLLPTQCIKHYECFDKSHLLRNDIDHSELSEGQLVVQCMLQLPPKSGLHLHHQRPETKSPQTEFLSFISSPALHYHSMVFYLNWPFWLVYHADGKHHGGYHRALKTQAGWEL